MNTDACEMCSLDRIKIDIDLATCLRPFADVLLLFGQVSVVTSILASAMIYQLF